jgi:3-oxoacyl-[acyl-carrier-protein] synthase-3
MARDGALYLSAIAGSPGDEVALEELLARLPADHGARLEAEGVRCVRVSSLPPAILALESARATLRRSAQHGHPVDGLDLAVMVSSNIELYSQGGLAMFLKTLNQARTFPLLVGGSGCGDLGAALRTLRGLFAVDDLRDALIVTSNTFDTALEERLWRVNWAVTGDAAASCLVTRSPIGPSFRLVDVRSVARSDVFRPQINSEEPTVPMARATFESVRHLVDLLCGVNALSRRDIRSLVLNNYGLSALRFYATAAGFELSDVFVDNLPRLGHCNSADPLLNLERLVDEDRVGPGDHVVVLADGVSCWTAMLLVREDGAS